MLWNLLVGLRCYVWAGLHESLQPCSRAARKWRENEEMRRKWRENEEMERDWLSTFPHSLSISSLFLHFLPLFPFPTSKCITFCCKMLNTALLSRMSQKSQHTRYEEIILGRTCCEEAPQFVPACFHVVTQSKVQCRITKTCLSNRMYGSMVIGNWFMHDITCIVFADRIWLIPIPHRLRSLPSAVYASSSPYTISWNVLLIG